MAPRDVFITRRACAHLVKNADAADATTAVNADATTAASMPILLLMCGRQSQTHETLGELDLEDIYTYK